MYDRRQLQFTILAHAEDPSIDGATITAAENSILEPRQAGSHGLQTRAGLEAIGQHPRPIELREGANPPSMSSAWDARRLFLEEPGGRRSLLVARLTFLMARQFRATAVGPPWVLRRLIHPDSPHRYPPRDASNQRSTCVAFDVVGDVSGFPCAIFVRHIIAMAVFLVSADQR